MSQTSPPSPPEDPAAKPSSDAGTDRSALAKYSGIAAQMAAIIGLSTWAGVWLDGRLRPHTPWFTIGLTLGGIFLALYQVIRSVSREG